MHVAVVSLLTVALPLAGSAQTERLTRADRSSLSRLGSSSGLEFVLQSGWYRGRPIQFYNFGLTDLSPARCTACGVGARCSRQSREYPAIVTFVWCMKSSFRRGPIRAPCEATSGCSSWSMPSAPD